MDTDEQVAVEEKADEPVALAEQTARDQAKFGDGDSVPGHADVLNAKATGAGIATDLRDGNTKTEPEKSAAWKPAEFAGDGQEYHAGPEQPTEE